MSSIFAGSFSRNGPFTSLSEILYSTIAASSPVANERLPDLRIGHLVGGQPLRLGESFQGFLGIFTKLAVDLPGRKPDTVEQHLDLDDGGVHSVIGGPLGGILGAVDGCSIKAGGSGRQQQPARQDGGDEQADHPATSSKNSDNQEVWGPQVPQPPADFSPFASWHLRWPTPTGGKRATSTAAPPAFRPASWPR